MGPLARWGGRIRNTSVPWRLVTKASCEWLVITQNPVPWPAVGSLNSLVNSVVIRYAE